MFALRGQYQSSSENGIKQIVLFNFPEKTASIFFLEQKICKLK